MLPVNLLARGATVQRLLEAEVSWAEFKPDEFQYAPCLLCRHFNHEPLASIVINWSEFTLVRCLGCGLIWRTPFPDTQHLTDLYSSCYYNVREHSPQLVYQVGIEDYTDEHRKMRRKRTQEEVQSWINYGILPRDGDGETRRFLEIGGGCGYLQQAASAKGWATVGLEISRYAIQEAIAKGLFVLPVSFEAFARRFIPYQGYFDLVALFDFLEHVTDPALTLRAVRNVLKVGGYAIFRVPVTDECPKLHLIDHIWHFSTETLVQLLAQERFVLEHSHPSGLFQAPSGDKIANVTIYAKKSA
jgi:SAM-dependent methyltransferase